MSRRFSIVAAALSPDPRVAAREARVMGFSGILFDSITGSLDVSELSQTGLREFQRVISGSSLGLVGLRHPLGPQGFSGDIERELRQLERVMKSAAA